MGHIYADVEAQLCLLGWNYIVIVVISHNGNGNTIYTLLMLNVDTLQMRNGRNLSLFATGTHKE